MWVKQMLIVNLRSLSVHGHSRQHHQPATAVLRRNSEHRYSNCSSKRMVISTLPRISGILLCQPTKSSTISHGSLKLREPDTSMVAAHSQHTTGTLSPLLSMDHYWPWVATRTIFWRDLGPGVEHRMLNKIGRWIFLAILRDSRIHTCELLGDY